MHKTAAIIIVLFLTGCTSITTQLREDGFNRQWAAFERIQGDRTYAEAEIRVKVIVTENMPAGWAGSYSHPQGVIRIRGKMVNGKIVVPSCVLGHEVEHALQFQTGGKFLNPDELKQLGY